MCREAEEGRGERTRLELKRALRKVKYGMDRNGDKYEGKVPWTTYLEKGQSLNRMEIGEIGESEQ